MVGELEPQYIKILVFIFILLSLIQISEEIFKSSYVNEDFSQEQEGFLENIINFVSQLPFIGILFNFFTITIPNAPLIITAILNIINSVIWIFFAVSLNNLIVNYLGIDEGLLGWLI